MLRKLSPSRLACSFLCSPTAAIPVSLFPKRCSHVICFCRFSTWPPTAPERPGQLPYVSLSSHGNRLSTRVPSASKLIWLSVCHPPWPLPKTPSSPGIRPLTHVLYCLVYFPPHHFFLLPFIPILPISLPFTNLPNILFPEFSSGYCHRRKLTGLWKQHFLFILRCSLCHMPSDQDWIGSPWIPISTSRSMHTHSCVKMLILGAF